MQAEAVIRALGALAQEHRLATFRLLVQAGADGMAGGQAVDLASVAPVGLPSTTCSVSSPSMRTSPRTGTVIVADRCPTRNETLPVVAV